jgi:riboflavin-specific deaminase-like protein
VELHRLHPDEGSLTAAEAAAELRAGARPHQDRPYLALNMVATADGRITIGGRSGPIGNEEDRALFHELRAQADAVMVGAGTARNEGYGRIVRDPDRRERRRQAGLDPDPLAVLVTARLALDGELPLLADPDSRVLIVTAAEGEVEGARAEVEYLRVEAGEAPGTVPLTPAMSELRARGIELVLCEGGPVLNATLLEEDLVDELFLAVASKLAGGAAPGVVAGGELDPPRPMELLSVIEAGGDVFLRYRIRAREASGP